MAWQELGAVAPADLGAARAQAHWAAQVLSAAGETYVAHAPDTSHTAMHWDAARDALVGAVLPGPEGLRLALRIGGLELALSNASGRTLASLPLAGRTLAEADAWTSGAVREHTRGRLDRALTHPDYELPPHALATHGRFEPDSAALGELARWYANAEGELRELAERTPGAGALLCWPHHFDLATLVEVERDASGEAVKTIGVGLSPGDEFVPEPYWYVNHGPEAEGAELPALAAGEWFTDGWTGAVLRGSAIAATPSAYAQRALVRRYLDSAVAASRRLLTPPSP